MIWPLRKPAAPVEEKAASGVSVPDDWLVELFTGSVVNATPVSASVAMTVPAVACAVRVISEAAATLDICFKRVEGDTLVDDNSHPAAYLLQQEANPWTSGFSLIRDLVSEALTRDAGGFAWVNRVSGTPREIIKFDAGNIEAQFDAEGTGEPTFRLQGRRLNPEDVIHVRGPFSRCPLTLARTAITVAQIMETHADKLFRNGAKPGGVIEVPQGIGEDALLKIRKMWRAAHEGVDKAGKTAILHAGSTFRPITLASTDAQFLELRHFQLTEIARAFSIPQHMLGILDRATWSNTESLGREFLVFCLEPWLKALEGALSRALFTPEERKTWRIVFDRDDLTRADLATRATAINSLVSSRVINPNEARQWLDLPPYAEGDTFANPNTGASQPGSSNSGGTPNGA